jgi:hypothetical protein
MAFRGTWLTVYDEGPAADRWNLRWSPRDIPVHPGFQASVQDFVTYLFSQPPFNEPAVAWDQYRRLVSPR